MKFIKFCFFVLMLLSISNCSTTRTNLGKSIEKKIELQFNSSGLALLFEGNGMIDVYENKLIIRITDATIKLNPKFNNKNYEIGDMYACLGKFTNDKNRKWKTFNRSIKKTINKKIDSNTDSLKITNYEFEVPYFSEKDLTDTWIVFKTTNKSREGWTYAHSLNKMQDFRK